MTHRISRIVASVALAGMAASALAQLETAEARRTEEKPLSGDAVIAIANVERELARNRREFEGEFGIDLITVGLRALGALRKP